MLMKYINKPKLCSLILVITLIFTLAVSYARNVHRDLSKSLVRLHIIANSDFKCDQELKIAVRDRLLCDFGEIFSECESAEKALLLADSNLDLIRAAAEDEIRRHGFALSVSAETGAFPFPTKVYGDIRLPAGRYNAVQVKIGNAEGQNWWCVMYPPLCFTDGIAHISDNSRRKLKNSLSNSEYKLITEASSENIPVKLRFKIVELLRGNG